MIEASVAMTYGFAALVSPKSLMLKEPMRMAGPPNMGCAGTAFGAAGTTAFEPGSGASCAPGVALVAAGVAPPPLGACTAVVRIAPSLPAPGPAVKYHPPPARMTIKRTE